MLLLAALALLPDDGAVDFNRDVLPILSEKCFACHGPDGGTREADLRLDRRDELYKEVMEDLWVIKPGDLARSELWYRVSTDDEYEVMPPFGSEATPVTDAERATLARWIEGGAEWSPHWAFEPPVKPEVPAGRNAIDYLAAEVRGGPAGLPAERAKLIRRASLDLTGLPPSVEEVDAFLADGRPDAYERLVDRLLDSPAYGEQRARRWLDLARYADTNGYEKDERRTMWRYRDWVINAYTHDLPFDRFTIEQLAGDLLPNPTTDQFVATGFHRNTMVNTEGGTDPEEFRVAAVIDRVNTTASVWLGATLACAQCHSHKYDPYTQREYYGLFAFFNSTEDNGNALAPEMTAPTALQSDEELRLRKDRTAAEGKLTAPDKLWDLEQAAWEPGVLAELGDEETWRDLWPIAEGFSTAGGGRLTRLGDGSLLAGGERGATDAYTIDTRLEGGGTITTLRIDVLAEQLGELAGPGGRADDGNFVVTDVEVELVSLAPAAMRTVRFAGATADFEQAGGAFPPQHATDDDATTGWAVSPRVRDPHWLELALDEPLIVGPSDVLRIRIAHGYGGSSWSLRHFRLSVTGDERAHARSLLPTRGDWVACGPFTGDGNKLWTDTLAPEQEHLNGVHHADRYGSGGPWETRTDWIDARVHSLTGEQSAWILRRTLTVDRPTDFDLRLGSDDSIRVYLNGVVVHDNKAVRGALRGQETVRVRLEAGENRLLMKIVNYSGPAGFAFETAPVGDRAFPRPVEGALRIPADARTPETAGLVRDHFRRVASERGRLIVAELAAADAALLEHRKSIPTAMVMRERGEPRPSFILSKGSFLAPGDPVQPHTPAVLHEFSSDLPRNRLGLAQWLVSAANPLTPRVVVNRAWEEVFGLGLVETSDDLGTRGDPPTSQALLDWLAVEFVESGWSTKALFRLLVTSDTYKQASRVNPDLIENDPRNTKLTRGSRYRLPAEAVRDNALAISGLLAAGPDEPDGAGDPGDPSHNGRIGGPSVFPPQPEGIWAATYNADSWIAATDSDRYRRGLYTFLRRTAPYPTYLMFDATSREVSCTRRARTNTPLQALAAMNDPAFVEAAGGLALRMIEEGGTTDAERLTYGFRLCVARRPAADELAVLVDLLSAERVHYAADAAAALQLDTFARPFVEDGTDRAGAVERAPWIVVANALLNLDETVTKN